MAVTVEELVDVLIAAAREEGVRTQYARYLERVVELQKPGTDARKKAARDMATGARTRNQAVRNTHRARSQLMARLKEPAT